MFSVEFDANIALSIWWFQAVTSLQTAMLAYSGTFLLPTSWGMPNIGRTENRGYVSRCWQKSPKWSLSPNPQGWQRSQMLCLWVGARAKKRYVRFHRCNILAFDFQLMESIWNKLNPSTSAPQKPKKCNREALLLHRVEEGRCKPPNLACV